MSGSSRNRIAGKCLTLLLLVLITGLVLNDTKRELFASAQAPNKRAEMPVVTRVEQGDAPLRIVNTFVETRGQDQIVIRVMLQNQSSKKIRAMAVAADGRTEFLNLSGAASVLLPTQIRTLDMSYVLDGLPKRVNISVDFVEFDDGTTWGADDSNSRDRLAGQRAGAKAERQRLKHLLKTKGTVALSDLPEGHDDAEPPPAAAGRSETWLHGYRGGVSAMRHRVRQALQAGNPKQAEGELNKPFDTSEGNMP